MMLIKGDITSYLSLVERLITSITTKSTYVVDSGKPIEIRGWYLSDKRLVLLGSHEVFLRDFSFGVRSRVCVSSYRTHICLLVTPILITQYKLVLEVEI